MFEDDNAPSMQVQDEEISLPGESAGNINNDDSIDKDKLPDDVQITQPDREITLSGGKLVNFSIFVHYSYCLISFLLIQRQPLDPAYRHKVHQEDDRKVDQWVGNGILKE